MKFRIDSSRAIQLRHNFSGPDPDIEVLLHLPSYGLFIYPDPDLTPRLDRSYPIYGEVEIRLGENSGPVSCRGIRLVLKSYCRINIGEDRIGEEDVTFEAVYKLTGSTTFQQPSQRFDFLWTLPSPLSQTTSCFNDILHHNLFVQVIGTHPGPRWTMKNGDVPPRLNLSHLGEEEYGEPDCLPAYEKVRNDKARPLDETIIVRRNVTVCYNPSPTGGINILDDRFACFVDGLGLIEARCSSNVFTVAGPMLARFEVPSPSAQTTIFAARLSILEKRTITSPRDGRRRYTEKIATFATTGISPSPLPKYPGVEMNALWRGNGAGGNDTQGMVSELIGRFPHCEQTRESTPRRIPTPVQDAHSLLYDIFYSVYGEEADGSKMSRSGPGALRQMRRSKPIYFPDCHMLPTVMNLPTYGSGTVYQTGHSEYDYLRNDPCPACKRRPLAMLCIRSSCASQLIPHVRHGDDADCAVCSGRSLAPAGGTSKMNVVCACRDWEKTNGEAGEIDIQGFRDVYTAEGQVDLDEMLAVKLDAEWTGKMPD